MRSRSTGSAHDPRWGSAPLWPAHACAGLLLISGLLGCRPDPTAVSTIVTGPAATVPVLAPALAPTTPVPSTVPATSAPSPVPVLGSGALGATSTGGALPASSPPAIRLLFTGDINPGRCPAQIALAHNDFTLPYQLVADTLRAADVTIGSLDGALSDLSAPSPCPQTMNLVGPSRSAEGLAYAGFDVITVATNHAKDCGALGWDCQSRSFLDTLHTLSAAGLLPVGGGSTLDEALKPVIVERGGVRFAFIGLLAVGPDTWATAEQPGTAPLSDDTLPLARQAVAAARAQADVVVVLPHWGIEYTETTTASQRRWAAALIDAGATLVIGNHPHLVQPVQVFTEPDGQVRGVAAYALGNFVFDQGPWRTRQGVVFEADFAGPALAAWQLLPIHIRSLYQPYWAAPDEARAILERVQAAGTAMAP